MAAGAKDEGLLITLVDAPLNAGGAVVLNRPNDEADPDVAFLDAAGWLPLAVWGGVLDAAAEELSANGFDGAKEMLGLEAVLDGALLAGSGGLLVLGAAPLNAGLADVLYPLQIEVGPDDAFLDAAGWLLLVV